MPDKDTGGQTTTKPANESTSQDVLLAYSNALFHHWGLTAFSIPSDGKIEDARVEKVERKNRGEKEKRTRGLNNSNNRIRG